MERDDSHARSAAPPAPSPGPSDDGLVRFLHGVIRQAVRVLAVLMVLVILWGIGDVVYVLYQRLLEPPRFLLNISDIFATFGAFLAVLIAIEIFFNITLYLRDNVIHVKLVIATALMAIARKVIVFDFKVLEPEYVAATAAVVLALGITYWLVAAKVSSAQHGESESFAE
ncbi:MAG: phosphate-starvation-inducible PsiE family protein [Gemmatimonadota bacterium]